MRTLILIAARTVLTMGCAPQQQSPTNPDPEPEKTTWNGRYVMADGAADALILRNVQLLSSLPTGKGGMSWAADSGRADPKPIKARVIARTNDFGIAYDLKEHTDGKLTTLWQRSPPGGALPGKERMIPHDHTPADGRFFYQVLVPEEPQYCYLYMYRPMLGCYQSTPWVDYDDVVYTGNVLTNSVDVATYCEQWDDPLCGQLPNGLWTINVAYGAPPYGDPVLAACVP